MEQNSKLHTAMMKAKADKTAARGKADADRSRSSSSGMGTDKGRAKAGGGGGGNSGGSGRGGTGGGRGSGTNRSGGTGRGSSGGNSPKGTGRGSDRSAGGRGGGSKGNESAGGSKGRQNGSGGSGKSGTGKGSSGGSGGKNGSGSSGSGKGSKGDGGRTQNSPAVSPRAERARGRQERAAARQAARHQRRSANQAANLADRSKDRDQDRANRQAAREERREAKTERKAERKAKREAAKAADDRTTLGEAVAEEAQRRWDKRRPAEKDKAAKDDGKAKDSTSDKDSEATTKKMSKDGPGPAADDPKDDSATKEPDDGRKTGEKPSDGTNTDPKDDTGTDDGPRPDDVKDPPSADDSGNGRSFNERLKDFFATAGEDTTPPGPEEPSRLRPEDLKVTVDRPDRPTRSPKSEPVEEEIPDAVIVDDPSDPFGAHVRGPAGLPRAPEPHTQRPGTTRPTAQEDPVASEVRKPASGQARMAAQHRTDITFGEYLMEMVNIAIAAAADKDRAQELAVALGKVADALRDMAADLVGDHNVATEVVDQITDLADAATRMKQLAERCATECGIASEAARLAAMAVGRTYGEDIKAMDDAGLAHASSAAHHD
ncbi:ATP/GTP-binding protein [Streptomyces sp. ISL-10]|uniref:ATP/GTP-binding protein n=1 Tax=Streptomyces sp. ISL-10 TaxID=2819172 RepID=UPI001BEC34FB|nr:ATP/GTP-binding protein [Streptomyces sp. ISL-10]MBT2369962.1 ATP/GTP-binding protein [Streptomyces sp. ISL-10]